MACPICHGKNVVCLNEVVVERDNFKTEQFRCRDCDCEWDWTFRHSLFRKVFKIRGPQWLKID